MSEFRHYYDHLWYAMVILAGIFFVADSNASQVVRKLQEENQSARQASAYLLQQVRTYHQQCQKDPPIGTLSCTWASDVQQMLNDYATYDEKFFPTLGPKSSAEIYSPLGSKPSSQQILTIRREIKAYNDSRCPVEVIGQGWFQMSRPSAICQSPPAIFCTIPHSDPLDGYIEKDIWVKRVAIASECIIPSLVQRYRPLKIGQLLAEVQRGPDEL